MKHLIISREYPPAPYAPGGIGTYVANIAHLMAERGEIVHVIGQRWDGAPKAREISVEGRLVVHRIGNDELAPGLAAGDEDRFRQELEGLKKSAFPNQWFAWRGALLAEKLIGEEAIDVVEGQEWEAPLYYLLLRRALGLGPERRAPCIVHLHSPTEIARTFNGDATTPRAYTTMKRMETYCIHAADALLCPSHYLARQCRELYGLAPERIKVIRLPVGFVPLVERSPEVWEHGSICYVGRIEPRKGIIEWFEAAMRVAQEDPTVHFDFVGADIWKMQRTLLERLPRPLLPRFRFHGSKPRSELPTFLAQAKAAVVPSRWENFPNVCIEAMSSGLPVIATRLGGMVELIEDEHNGWLAPNTGVAGMVDVLADTLRRCLATSAERRAEMGRVAAESVRRICDNERTADEQIAFRADVARAGVARSLGLGIASRDSTGAARHGEADDQATDRAGAGIVIRVERLSEVAPVLESIRSQTKAPRAFVIVTRAAPSAEEAALLQQIEERGGFVIAEPACSGTEAWSAGLAASPQAGAAAFWLFLDRYDRLVPHYLEAVERVLLHRPEVGIVSCWTAWIDGAQRLDANPCPEAIYQLMSNDVALASAFRAEAVGTAAPFRPGLPRGYDVWGLANAVIAKGWTAVTYPALLVRRGGDRPQVAWPDATALRAIRAELLSAYPAAVEPNVRELIDLFVPIPSVQPHETPFADRLVLSKPLGYLITALTDPSRAYRALVRRSRYPLERRRQSSAASRRPA